MREIYNLLIFSGFERILPQRLWARSSVQLLQSLHDCRWNVSGWWITRDKSDQSSKTTSNVEFVGIIVEMTDGTFLKRGQKILDYFTSTKSSLNDALLLKNKSI